MLMTEMQMVVSSQQKYPVDDIVKSFERGAILKLDELKTSGAAGAKGTSPEDDKEVCPAPGGGRWYNWDGHYRRVPHDYEFPNKMTLKNAWLRYFHPDQVNNIICSMRYFSGTDLQNMKTGRRNLSAYMMLIQFMISEAKRNKVNIDKPTEDEANKMYGDVAGCVISLNDSRRM